MSPGSRHKLKHTGPEYVPGLARELGVTADVLPKAPHRERKVQSSEERHGGVHVDHKHQLPRLRRIEGQVRGLQQMIVDERHCLEVAQQINAAVAALRRVQADMLRDHLKALVTASVTNDLPAAERQRLAQEVADLLAKA